MKRAAELRAKLLAQRQRAAAHHLREAELNANGAATGKQTNAAMETRNQKEFETGNDPFSVESLLTEGKNAEAAEGPDKNLTSTARPSIGPDQAILSNLANDHHPQGAVSAPKQSVDRTKNDYALQTQVEHLDPPTDLTHAYYTDLPLWLEITGYHDIDYRNSQLANIKERKRLEQDAARIAERLAKLNQDAKANISFKRPGPAVQPSCETQRPPLPAMMPSATAATAVASIKRAHSPVELLPSKKMSLRPKLEEHSVTPRYDTPTGDLTRRITFPEPRRGPSRGHLQAAENRRGHERDGRAPSPAGYPGRGRLHGGENGRQRERDGEDPSVAPWVRRGRCHNFENRLADDRALPGWRDHDVYMPPRGNGPPNGHENRPDLRYSSVNVRHDGGPTGPRRGRLPPRQDERK